MNKFAQSDEITPTVYTFLSFSPYSTTQQNLKNRKLLHYHFPKFNVEKLSTAKSLFYRKPGTPFVNQFVGKPMCNQSWLFRLPIPQWPNSFENYRFIQHDSEFLLRDNSSSNKNAALAHLLETNQSIKLFSVVRAGSWICTKKLTKQNNRWIGVKLRNHLFLNMTICKHFRKDKTK